MDNSMSCNVRTISTDTNGKKQLVVFLRSGKRINFKFNDNTLESIVKQLEKALNENLDFVLKYNDSVIPSCRIRNNDIAGYKICERNSSDDDDKIFIDGNPDIYLKWDGEPLKLDFDSYTKLAVALNIDNPDGNALPISLGMNSYETLNVKVENEANE